MIEYIKGDLFADKHEIIAHGVNCQGVMNSGFAKQIRERFPEAYDRYIEACEQRVPENNLGRVRIAVSNDIFIMNCFTQLDYGKDGKRYVSYDAVDDCMTRIREFLELNAIIKSKQKHVAMPKIGAGLGGGEWCIIEAIINHRLKDHTVKVYEL